MYALSVDAEAQVHLIRPLATHLQQLQETADTNSGERTAKQLKDELVTFIGASNEDVTVSEIYKKPVTEKTLSHPTQTTWFRCDIQDDYIAKDRARERWRL